MTARQFTFTVQAQTAISNTVIGQIAAAMQPGTYSFELADPAWRWLGGPAKSQWATENKVWHPARQSGYTTINDPVDHWGSTTPGFIRDTNGVGYPFLESYNENNTSMLTGLGGPSQSDWDSTLHQWIHVAGTTGSIDASHGIMRYDAATDAFSHFVAPGLRDSANSLWPGRGGAHTFQRNAYDHENHILYACLVPSGDGRDSPQAVCAADMSRANTNPADRSWLTILGESAPSVPSSGWPQARFVPNRGGPNGSIFSAGASGANTRPWIFDIGTQTWSRTTWTADFSGPRAGPSPTNYVSLQPATIFHQRAGEVGYYYWTSVGYDAAYAYTSTDLPTRRFYRVAVPTSGDIPSPERLADAPVDMDQSGYASGAHTNLAVLNDQIYAFHHDTTWDTGTVRDGGIWRYDIATNTWSDKLDAIWDEQLYDLIAGPGYSTPASRKPYAATVAAIPELGAFICVANPWQLPNHAIAFLWKPPA